MSKDEIYRNPRHNIEDFCFNKTISDAFDDMIDRSVPGYRTLIANIGPIAALFIKENTNCYDLGCAHGAAALSIFESVSKNNYKIIAVDNAPAMIEKCQQLITGAHASSTIETHINDIMDIKISNASLVLLNLTLQFIAIEQRAQIIRKIYDGLNDGGACILTEKIILQNKNSDRLFQQMHENFKLANKYSQLEISQKRKALENVLVRESLEVHTQRLTQSGFTNVNTWFQCMNFVSILAIK